MCVCVCVCVMLRRMLASVVDVESGAVQSRRCHGDECRRGHGEERGGEKECSADDEMGAACSYTM